MRDVKTSSRHGLAQSQVDPVCLSHVLEQQAPIPHELDSVLMLKTDG
jgi:hypothetical protein